ncbi:MAG: hypothetical protein KDI13_08130 [Alphaproteobacteria bacterium]|nr:hypothetical protein [Alphaproteobacteria bacterium]
MTQNQNLIAKPDSTLSFCFRPYMNHLAWYAERSFPGNPQESQGGYSSLINLAPTGPILFIPGVGGVWTDLLVTIRKFLGTSVDPYLTEGLDMNSVLEILILDSLVDNVSLWSKASTTDDGLAMLCPKGRMFYLEKGFGTKYLGNRTTLNSVPGSSITDSSFNCSAMYQVWNIAKCYDFNSEPTHDGFYTFEEYEAKESAGGDYREHLLSCWDSDDELFSIACHYFSFNQFPSWPIGFFWPWNNSNVAMVTTWSHSNNVAFPNPGGSGAMDNPKTFLNLMNTAACGGITPIKTGVKIKKLDGTTYDDAVCPAPGCWYDGSVCKP